MKFLAFFFTACLLTAQSHAQSPSTVTVAPPPAWGGVIDKFAKEGVPEPADNTDAKLATEAYSEQERAARAGGARPPAKAASAPSSAVATDKAPKPGQEDEFTKSVNAAVKDLMNPFKEVLIEQNSEKRQEGDPLARAGSGGQGQQAFGGNTTFSPPKTQNNRQQDKLRSDRMVEELIEELKPWALGAMVVAFIGFCVNLWLGYAKRKNQRSKSSASSSSSSSRAGPSSGYSTGTPRSHLETNPGRSASRKSSNRS